MSLSIALPSIIKFPDPENIKPVEILMRLTKQFREETLSKDRMFTLHKDIKDGCEHVENKRRLMVVDIAVPVMLIYGSTFSIITDELEFKKGYAR